MAQEVPKEKLKRVLARAPAGHTHRGIYLPKGGDIDITLAQAERLGFAVVGEPKAEAKR